MMSFGRATLESKCRRIFRPVAAPIKHIVIRKIVPRLLLLDGHCFQLRVVPNERPEILSVDLAESLQPFSNALCFATLKALSHAIEQVVIGIEMALRMCARIFIAFSGAG